MFGIEEIWKDIEDYEGLYKISNLGRIWSYKTNKILKGSIDSHGYRQADFRKNGIRKLFLIHRLVAKAFIPNPDNLPQVNHKDENPLNNNADNLEWCTREYNLSYGTIAERKSKKMSGKNNPFYGKTHTEEIKKKLSSIHCKRIYTIDGIFVSIIKCAEYYNINHHTLYNWLKGRNKIPKKYIYLDLRYATEEDLITYELVELN